MNRLHAIAFGALVASSGLGCVNVTSSVAGETAVNGEAWYVRTTGFAGLTFAADVFYCPPPQGEGPATCTQAEMYGEGDPFTAAATQAVDDAADDEPESEEPDAGEATEAEPADGEPTEAEGEDGAGT